MILIVSILVLPIFSPPVDVSSQNTINEKLTVYTLSDNALLNLTITDYKALRQKLMQVLDVNNDLLTLEIRFTFIRNWESSYNYFLYGDIFKELKFDEYPRGGIELTINTTLPGLETSVVNRLEELLFTKFIKVEDRYIAYSEFDTFAKLFSLIIPQGNYTPLLRWVDPLALRTLGEVLIFDLFSSPSQTEMEIYVFKKLDLDNNRWRLSNVISTSVPLKNVSNVVSEVDLVFKNSYIYSKPDINMSGGYIKEVGGYYYKIIDPYSIKSPNDVQFELFSYKPIIIVNRFFNTTEFQQNSFVEVMLNITVPDWSGPLFNITINESKWWINNGLSLVSGKTDKFFNFIDAGETVTLEYVVKVETSDPMDIYIEPAKVKIEFLDGLSLKYISGSNIIHLNRQAPLLNVVIESVDKDFPESSDIFKYTVSLTNSGSEVAKNVIFAGFIVGDLDPKDNLRVNESIRFTSLKDLNKSINVEAKYTFGNKSYSLSSPSVTIYPFLNSYVDFDFRVSYQQTKVNETMSSYSIRIFGESSIESIANIVIRIFGGRLVDSTYNLSRMNEYYIAENVDLSSEDAFTMEFNVSYPENTINLVPDIEIRVKNKVVYRNTIDYFFNTIDVSVEEFDEFLMQGESYVFKAVITNQFNAPIYNLTATWAGGDEEINIFPNEVSRAIIEGPSIEEIEYNFTAPAPGNYSMPDLRLAYWYLGKLRVDSIPLRDVSVLSGIQIFTVENFLSARLNENITIRFRIVADYPSKYEDVRLSLDLPEGLSLLNEISGSVITIDLTDNEQTVEIILKATNPGEFLIENVTLFYIFSNNEFVSQIDAPIKLSIREPVTQTYLIWFVIAILVTLVISLFIRRKLQ